MKNKLLLTALLLLFYGCNQLQYVDDLTYMSPDKANNPTFLAFVNGHACKDMTGSIGNCSLTNKINQPLTIKILKQPYQYKLEFRCGNKQGIHFKKILEIFEMNKELVLTIPTSTMEGHSYFNCIGDITPLDDRPNDASNFFEFRVRFISDYYIEPMTIFTTKYKRKKYLVLGQNAYRSKILAGGKWYFLKEQTTFRYKTRIDFAVSETKNMRRSYFGEINR